MNPYPYTTVTSRIPSDTDDASSPSTAGTWWVFTTAGAYVVYMQSSNASESAHSVPPSYVIVKVNVYDFLRGNTYSGSVLAFFGMGIHHSGLQIQDREWTFNTSGIVCMPGLRMPGCRLNESIVLGRFWGDGDKIDEILIELGHKYQPGTYNLIDQNCNHFVEDFSQRLIGVSIPSWVNRSAHVAHALGISLSQRHTISMSVSPISRTFLCCAASKSMRRT